MDEFKKAISENTNSLKEKKEILDKILISKFASSIEKSSNSKGEERWEVTFKTRYGNSKAVFYPTNGKWHALGGSARGRGGKSMLEYYKPLTVFKAGEELEKYNAVYSDDSNVVFKARIFK